MWTWITRLHTALITRMYFLSLLQSISQNRLNFPKIHVLNWKKTRHYGKVISRLKGWVKHWRWITSFFETHCMQSIFGDWLMGSLGWPIEILRNLTRFEGTFHQVHAKGSFLTFHQTKLKTINTIKFKTCASAIYDLRLKLSNPNYLM